LLKIFGSVSARSAGFFALGDRINQELCKISLCNIFEVSHSNFVRFLLWNNDLCKRIRSADFLLTTVITLTTMATLTVHVWFRFVSCYVLTSSTRAFFHGLILFAVLY